MFTTRNNTFETNSSSTHALIVTNKKLYDAFLNGDEGVYFDFENCEFVRYTDEQILELKNKFMKDNSYYISSIENVDLWDIHLIKTVDGFEDLFECEQHEKVYTTDSGEEIIAIAFYDGE